MINSEGPASTSNITEAVLRPLLDKDPHRPRLTWYGMGRTELSTASLANWSAKVAGLLDAELGAAPGDDAAIVAQPSWQLLPIALGAWWAGLSVVDHVAADGVGGIAAAVFTDYDRSPGIDADEFVVSPHPFGVPVGKISVGQADFTSAVLHQADRYVPRPVGAGETAEGAVPWHGENPLPVADLVALVRAGASDLGPAPRLVVPPTRTVLDLAVTLLAALAADGSLLVIDPSSGNDPAVIAADERGTATAWLELPGIARAAAWEGRVADALGPNPGLPD